MINLSINSACNNNCDYCFQKDSYHLLNKEMSLEEVVNIIKNKITYGIGKKRDVMKLEGL